MISIVYLVLFLASIILVLRDKDFESIQQPCTVCMPRYLILLTFIFLFSGAEYFSFFASHRAWIISGVMALSMSGFLLGSFFVWERKKPYLALMQFVFAAIITIHFYAWW
ncbi:MAG TPA: hypothetical protein ENJ32_13710 [Crenotrichaceae bacterium]|nr:hypothetical protein [Crenotrichaceae bacterium]